MNTWLFFDTGLNTGIFNMEYDIKLCEDFKTDNISRLRFYQWQPYSLSLGYNQKEDNLLKNKLADDNIDIVKRPTGGRAVLHSEELTYSVITNLKNRSSHQLYSDISKAIVIGFHLYDERLKAVELEKNQVDFSTFYKSHASIPCFSSSAKYEIKLGEKKIVGSAQRTFQHCILQHGSILCGTFHKNLINYLQIKEDDLAQIKNDLDEKTISLSEILNEKINYNRLKDCIKKGFKEYFTINFRE